VRGWFRRTPLAAARWIVIDCESSGLDPERDRLLSVGALPVREGRIELAQAFASRARQQAPSAPENILIHGIGGDAQLDGLPLEDVVRELAARVDGAWPVGFHARFDEVLLRRHGFAAQERWLDLALVAPLLFPKLKAGRSSLDEWLGAFGIPVHARHDALGDAFLTAQLLLVVLAEAQRQGIKTTQALQRLPRHARWL
jgi:DNA polymerase-3 subunit epsilon